MAASVRNCAECLNHSLGFLVPHFLPVRSRFLFGPVRQKCPLRIWPPMLLARFPPSGRELSECRRCTRSPEVSSQNSGDGSVFETPAAKLLEHANHGSVGLIVLPIKQSVAGRPFFGKRIETNHCGSKVSLFLDGACLQKMPHPFQYHAFAIIFTRGS